MNSISMFSSSENLRSSLHRVLSVCQILSASVAVEVGAGTSPPSQEMPWWQTLAGLAPGEKEAARAGKLPRQRIGELLCGDDGYALLRSTWQHLDLPPLPTQAQMAAAFRDAEISSLALSQHGGRDVYGSSNKRLWDLLVTPLQAAISSRWGTDLLDWYQGPMEAEMSANQTAIACLTDLIAFDTRPEGRDHGACVTYICKRLTELGFSVEVIDGDGPPIVAARRPAQGLLGTVVMYGHYDVAPLGRSAFTYPPMKLTAVSDDGGHPAAAHHPRLFGRGVADNKGPLALRLTSLEELRATPELHFLLQGEEETGSRRAHAIFPQRMGALRPTIWLDETGYHDHADGTLRLLARTIGTTPDMSCPPDPALRELLLALRMLASRHQVETREEWRSLNKSEVLGGCPFNHNLPASARYLALGINDTRAQIHRADESIPTWTFQLHREELQLLFHWVDLVARAAA